MRPTMAPEIAEHLGYDAERHLEEAEKGIGMCRDCSRPIETKDPSSLVLLISDPADAPDALTMTALTHATCSGSEIRRLPPAEIRNYLAAADHPSNSVSAMSAVLQVPGEAVRPVLFVSNHGEVTLVADDGRRIDSATLGLFAGGWEPVSQVKDKNPDARVEARVSFTPLRHESPWVVGRLVISTDEEVMADLELAVHPLWAQLIGNEGEVAVYFGRLSVQHWTTIDWARVEREINNGRLAGAMLPADMVGF